MKTLHNRCLVAFVVMAAMTCVWPQSLLADEVVTLEQLPPVVSKTLQRESTGGTIGKIEKETKQGRVIYEAEVMLDGREYEVVIAANGILIKKELQEQKEQVDWTFEKSEVGSAAKGWKVAETNGKEKTATWVIGQLWVGTLLLPSESQYTLKIRFSVWKYNFTVR